MARLHPETISPTAHYTGYVWFAHGKSHEAFATRTGRLMYQALRGPNVVAQRVNLPTLEGMLLARHRLIDLRLTQAIEAASDHRDRGTAKRWIDSGHALERVLRQVEAGDSHALGLLHWSDVQYGNRPGCS